MLFVVIINTSIQSSLLAIYWVITQHLYSFTSIIIFDQYLHLKAAVNNWFSIFQPEGKEWLIKYQYSCPLILLLVRQEEDKSDQARLGTLTNFRQFFRLAAKDLSVSVRQPSFDSSVVEVPAADAHDFLGTLDYLLKKATPTVAARRTTS